MENSFIITIVLMLSITFLQMNHPVAAGLTILIQATMIAMYTGLTTKTFWFSYTLFLIFVGGLLVLFVYVTAISSNEMFSLSSKSFMTTMITTLMTFITLSIFYDPLFMYSNSSNLETLSIHNITTLIPESSIMLNKIYSSPTNLMTIMLVIYLLLSLIVIVKITNIFSGPLRSK